jgi:hypothetical protein
MSTWSTNPMSTPGPPPMGVPDSTIPRQGGPAGPSGPYGFSPAGPPKPPRSGANPALIVGLLLLVAGLIAGGVLLVTTGDDDKTESENASSRRERPEQQEDEQDCAGSSLQQVDGGSSDDGATGCTPPEPVDTEITVPTLPEPPDAPDVPTSSDVVDALASDIYGNTPASIDRATSNCMATVIVDVVGESAVADADADYEDVYADTSASQDAAISSGIYSTCTTTEQDADLHADPNWPGPWGPGVGDAPADLPDSEVLDALASDIYSNTPGSIDEATANCMATVIIDVVGESTVAAAGADYQDVYSGSSPSQDDAISSGIYSTCTTTEQDADLHADPNWPGPWGPSA